MSQGTGSAAPGTEGGLRARHGGAEQQGAAGEQHDGRVRGGRLRHHAAFLRAARSVLAVAGLAESAGASCTAPQEALSSLTALDASRQPSQSVSGPGRVRGRVLHRLPRCCADISMHCRAVLIRAFGLQSGLCTNHFSRRSGEPHFRCYAKGRRPDIELCRWRWRNLRLCSIGCLQGSGESDALWVLKADVHRGEGLRFAPARAATAEALRSSADGGRSWALAQRFVAPQLLIGDTPFYIRCARSGTYAEQQLQLERGQVSRGLNVRQFNACAFTSSRLRCVLSMCKVRAAASRVRCQGLGGGDERRTAARLDVRRRPRCLQSARGRVRG